VSDALGTIHWPVEIRLKQAERILEIDFDNGAKISLPAEYLRVESPSAEVQGHSPDQKQLVAGCATVGIASLQPIGNYAIRITFDDGHDSGIYSWAYLYTLGMEHDKRWRDYLAALSRAGLSRDKPRAL
jgi:DUF971 family protein